MNVKPRGKCKVKLSDLAASWEDEYEREQEKERYNNRKIRNKKYYERNKDE